MLTGQIRNQVDQVWNAFWSGGVSNPLAVIEQITYLLFIKRLDELHTLEENKASRLGKPMERRIFPEGTRSSKGRAYEDMRWSRFKNFEPARDVSRSSTSTSSPSCARSASDGIELRPAHEGRALRASPTPALLAKVVDCSTKSRWRIATPRATSTSTCSARSPPPGRTASSARRGTSSG